MPLADLEVHRVMGRGNLHRPGAKGGVDSAIGDYWDQPANSGQDRSLAHHFLISIILRVHRHCGVTEDGLGTSGGHGDAPILTGEPVVNIIKMPRLFLMLHLQVGEGG